MSRWDPLCLHTAGHSQPSPLDCNCVFSPRRPDAPQTVRREAEDTAHHGHSPAPLSPTCGLTAPEPRLPTGNPYWTSKRDGEVHLRREDAFTSQAPFTVHDLVMNTAIKYANYIALGSKHRNGWHLLTYIEYYEECRRAAKAFLKVPRSCLVCAQWHSSRAQPRAPSSSPFLTSSTCRTHTHPVKPSSHDPSFKKPFPLSPGFSSIETSPTCPDHWGTPRGQGPRPSCP
uniref:Uncharacterized protein n=1 Tax=Ursus americanus TaxID=9643 RepID=A0A452Q9Y2_URSAM